MKAFELNGYKIQVFELENAVIDESGRKLYGITVDGDEFNNIRAYSFDSAINIALKEVENNFTNL